jgi:hypothetical protein
MRRTDEPSIPARGPCNQLIDPDHWVRRAREVKAALPPDAVNCPHGR